VEAAVVLPPVRAEAPLRRYVDPLIGTGGDGFGTGSAFPGPQRPFGMARPGPDTTDAMGAAVSYAHCAGYAHFDTHIAAFSQIHLHGTGIVDEGSLGFMPVVGMSPARTRRNGHLAPFRHARETASAGYYRVTFDDTERRGLERQLHAVLYEDQPYTFLTNRPQLDAIKTHVRGIRPSLAWYDLRRVWLLPPSAKP